VRPGSDIAVEYRENAHLDPVDVARVFDASGIRRPTDDPDRIGRMFSAPSLTVSAWAGGKLVGVSRFLTDHAYCCYLSDLAVDKEYQGLGIGRELVRRTRECIGEEVTLILLSAPGAMSYYPALGFELAPNAYIVHRRR
jgi:ribosomal protein S18 acetylase RimI-like enzyme